MVSCVLTGTTREIVGRRNVSVVLVLGGARRPSMIRVEGSIADEGLQYKALRAFAHPPHHIGDTRQAHLAALMKRGNLQKEEEALHAFRWTL